VQQAVEKLFGRRPSKRINPDEAVALGAALLADEIGSATAPALLDILPMSVGRGLTGLVFEPIVKRYSRLPAQAEITVDADLLGSVTFPIFQGESSDVSRNEYICSAMIEDRSLFEKGRVVLHLSFDEHCVMAVGATNARTKAPLAVRLDRTRPLDEVLRDLGKYSGPVEPIAWQKPQSRIGAVLGKLFKVFGR
jgi:molecular chaperone DnaK (HSP70)